ncbi:MAG: HAD family hydrolase [Myxococcota bacterium]|nr:HAD family hydrolase [Myxococcota bacterium]
MSVRAVVFDLFDTLVDLRFEELPRVEHEGRWLPASATLLHEAVAERAEVSFADYVDAEIAVRERLGAPRYAEGRELPTGERFAAVTEHLGVRDPDLPELLTSIHMGVLKAAVSVPDHHEGLLAALHRELRLALCSNFTHSETAHRVLDEAGFRPHLDAVAVSDAVGWRKPRPEIFAAVLDELGVAPDEVLHVGDNLRADVTGGRDAGLRTVWITRRVANPQQKLQEHEGHPPDFVVDDLAELPRLVSRLAGGGSA